MYTSILNFEKEEYFARVFLFILASLAFEKIRGIYYY